MNPHRVIIDVHINIATSLDAESWEENIRYLLAETLVIDEYVPGDEVTITAREVPAEEVAA